MKCKLTIGDRTIKRDLDPKEAAVIEKMFTGEIRFSLMRVEKDWETGDYFATPGAPVRNFGR